MSQQGVALERKYLTDKRDTRLPVGLGEMEPAGLPLAVALGTCLAAHVFVKMQWQSDHTTSPFYCAIG